MQRRLGDFHYVLGYGYLNNTLLKKMTWVQKEECM